MDSPRGETWRFSVHCSQAEHVYLVKDSMVGKSLELMVPQGLGNWAVEARLIPGRYRMTYFIAEGTTYFNGGSFGLTGTRLGEPDPDVIVEQMEHPLPA